MSEYHYSHLSASSIRLLRLLPSGDNEKHLGCELFEYPLQHSDKSSHPYEALSYVWGSEDKPKSITINDQTLHITQNLYTVLLRLQDHLCSRVIWIDAICIDQANEREKEDQIPLIAEIYAKARRVLVWLGEAEDDSDQALEEIRRTGVGDTIHLSNAKPSQQAISKLLQRPWFQRIWILQEVAAARHILIMCGSTEIDGHAFASGLDFLDRASADMTTQVAFLIRGAVFRSRNIIRTQDRISLDICSLGELLDMYHTHEATKVHDLVYALLNMCSDDLSTARLAPDYTLQWSILMERLVKFILGNNVSVSSWENKETAIIMAKGCILGKVTKVDIKIGSGGGQTLEAIFKNTSKQIGHIGNGSACWTLPTSAKLIQKGDLICLLQGALKATILRLREDYFEVIMIAASPPKHLQKDNDLVNWSELSHIVPFTRDFLLVWDWKVSSGMFQDRSNYDDFIQTNSLKLNADTQLPAQLSAATRIWHVALILGDLGEYQEEEERLRVAVEGYGGVIGGEHQTTLKSWHGLTPLLWAAVYGHDAIVQLLLTKDDVDIDLRDSQFDRTPLSWAAENGQDGIVMQLLDTEKVDVDSRDKYDRTPLSWAAEKGQDSIVMQLLDTEKVDVDSRDKYDRTPLSWAAMNGHEAVVKLLLASKANIEAKDRYDQTPLWWAAENGFKAVVKLLLKSKADVEAKDRFDGMTPLLRAAINGHEAIVKLLLEGKATSKRRTDSMV